MHGTAGILRRNCCAEPCCNIRRNTPSVKDGLSPAQKLYGHPIQDIIPAHDRSFDMTGQSNTEEAEDKAEARPHSITIRMHIPFQTLGKEHMWQSRIRALKCGAPMEWSHMSGRTANTISKQRQEECWCATEGLYDDGFLHLYLAVTGMPLLHKRNQHVTSLYHLPRSPPREDLPDRGSLLNGWWKTPHGISNNTGTPYQLFFIIYVATKSPRGM